MKKILWTSLGVVLLAVACGQRTDGSNDAGPTGTNDAGATDAGTDAGTQAATLEGSWLSEGSDVAPLLAGPPAGLYKVVATFNANGSYTVVGSTDAGSTLNFAGTYATESSSVNGIQTITLNQSAPTTATSAGIYQIDGNASPVSMKYEVVQTNPSLGTPPTAEAGFGSSAAAGGPLGQANVQKYKKQ